MSGVSDPSKPYHFLKSVMRTFRRIYVNYFNSLRFLAEVSIKLQKNTLFFDNLKSVTQKGNMETRPHFFYDPFYSSSFSVLSVCNFNFCI